MSESLWFTTRSALFRPGDAAWNEVAAYAEPLRRLLDRRYSWLPAEDREDLVQELLIEMKQALVARHDRSRARFRALLQTVVERRVADRLRRRRAVGLESALADDLAAPPPAEVAALDLETRLVEAVAACRDRFTQGSARDHDVLYALADRLVRGLSSKEIAARDAVSEDRIARLLERARHAIFEHLLSRELALAAGDARLAAALAAFKESLRRPRETARILERLADPALAENLADLLDSFRAALRERAGDATASGEELRRGLAFVLESAP